MAKKSFATEKALKIKNVAKKSLKTTGYFPIAVRIQEIKLCSNEHLALSQWMDLGNAVTTTVSFGSTIRDGSANESNPLNSLFLLRRVSCLGISGTGNQSILDCPASTI